MSEEDVTAHEAALKAAEDEWRLANDPHYLEEKKAEEEELKAIKERGGEIYETTIEDIMEEKEDLWDPVYRYTLFYNMRIVCGALTDVV